MLTIGAALHRAHTRHRRRDQLPPDGNAATHGMAEVSSCMIEALPGRRVCRGEELGYFQYRGSPYCLIFRPGVIESFERRPPYNDHASAVQVMRISSRR